MSVVQRNSGNKIRISRLYELALHISSICYSTLNISSNGLAPDPLSFKGFLKQITLLKLLSFRFGSKIGVPSGGREKGI